MDLNDKTLTLFKSFINDIIKVFPEHKECIDKNYCDVLELEQLSDNEIVNDFLKLIDDNSNDISNKNSEVFTDDLYLIKEISMKSIWDSDISNKTKENMWKYLQAFCVINISRNSNDKINEVLKSIELNEKVTDKKTVKEIKKIKKINENLKKEDKEDEDKEDKEGVKATDMDDLLNNTSIGNLAKEITEDLKLDEMGEDGISEMMKPENMMNMFQTINKTLTEKIGNNELDGNALLGEASGLMNNDGMMKSMMGMFSGMDNGAGKGGEGMPDLSGMMGMLSGMDNGAGKGGEGMPDLSGMMNMFQNMQQQPQQQQPQQSQPKSKQSSNHDPDVVRERLRNKLNNKQ